MIIDLTFEHFLLLLKQCRTVSFLNTLRIQKYSNAAEDFSIFLLFPFKHRSPSRSKINSFIYRLEGFSHAHAEANSRSNRGRKRSPFEEIRARSAYPGHVIRNSRLGSGEICRGSQLECLFNFRASRVTEEREPTHSHRLDRVCSD